MSSLQSILVLLPKARQSLGISLPTHQLLIEQNRSRTGPFSKKRRVLRELLAFDLRGITDDTLTGLSLDLLNPYFRGVRG